MKLLLCVAGMVGGALALAELSLDFRWIIAWGVVLVLALNG